MATIKGYTDLEQSKKLAEFLPLESADMYWKNGVSDKYIQCFTPFVIDSTDVDYDYDVPCWSLVALIKLLPSEFTERDEYSETTYKIDIRKYALTDDVDVYQIAYGNYHWYEDGSHSWSDMVNSGQREELIDVCYEMILKLHELNLL